MIGALLGIVISIGARAQEKKETANFAHWVIESNVKSPKISVVKFYNDQQELIYQETISGKRMNIKRTKIKKGLDQALAQLIDSPVTKNTTLLASRVKNW